MIVTPLSTFQSWAKLSLLILAQEPKFTFIYKIFVNRKTHPCYKCGLWNEPIANCVLRVALKNYVRASKRDELATVIYPSKCRWIKGELYKVTVPFHKFEQTRFSDLSKRQARIVEEIEVHADNVENHINTEKLHTKIVSARVRLKLTHREEAIFDLAFKYPYLFECFFTPKGNLPKDLSRLFNEFTIQLYFLDNKSLVNAIQRLKTKFRTVIRFGSNNNLPLWERIEVLGEIPDWGNDWRYNWSYPRMMKAFENSKEKKDYSPICSES